MPPPHTPRRAYGLLLVALLLLQGHGAHGSFRLLNEGGQPGASISTTSSPHEWLTTLTKSWMTQLNSSIPIFRLSIPGTHDTGAFTGGPLCETQAWDVTEQLLAGVRFFDMRNRRTGREFSIHHGVCYLFQKFDDVLDDIDDFLRENPGETVIMRVKDEFKPRVGSDSFQDIWDRYMTRYRALFVDDLGDSLPTLGQIRGKILVLRDADFNGVGLRYTASHTQIQDFYQVYRVPNDHPFGSDTVSLDQKTRFITDYLTRARDSEKLILNFVSGSTGMSPFDVAQIANPHVYGSLGSHQGIENTGILILDYPGERLLYRIIKTNFPAAPRATTVCAKRTVRTKSDETFADFRMPAAKAGRVIRIKKGAYADVVRWKCHRATWTDLTFTCGSDGLWRYTGSIDADGWCNSFNEDQPYLAVGRLR